MPQAPHSGGIFRPIRVFSDDGCEAYTGATLTGTTADTARYLLPTAAHRDKHGMDHAHGPVPGGVAEAGGVGQ